MKNIGTLLFLGVILCSVPGGASAGTISLADLALNDNGTFTDGIDFQSPPSPLTSTLDASGLGTLTYSLAPGVAGSYFMALFMDYEVSSPFWNEYGAVSGTPAASQTWQIDSNFGDGNFVNPTLFTNVQNNTLDNTNHIPGDPALEGTGAIPPDNFLNTCGANVLGGTVAPTCNTDVAMGMGFSYSLTADQQVIITFLTSTTAPDGGFYLEQIHPVDGQNSAASAVYLSANILIEPTGGTQTPEPGTWLLCSGALMLVYAARKRRKSNAR